MLHSDLQHEGSSPIKVTRVPTRATLDGGALVYSLTLCPRNATRFVPTANDADEEGSGDTIPFA
eukprot:scaffold10038_cov267-Chaetoceros_neogracile.AAC.19